MINPHYAMLAICLFSIFLVAYLYVKPAILFNYNDPMQNRAYTPCSCTTWYYAEDLLTPQTDIRNIISLSVLIAILYFLIRVANMAYRQLSQTITDKHLINWLESAIV